MATSAPTASSDRRSGIPWLRPSTVAASAFAALTVLFLAAALLVALALPYGEWDAMSFGVWSRVIAEHWPHLRFAGIGEAEYQRPLFYVLQGSVWSALGFHQPLGRLLSLGFSALLLASTAWIAAQTVRVDRRLAAGLGLLVTLLVAGFGRYLAAGMSDIPAAAMVALTAALLLAPRLRGAQLPLVALASALAALAKPSALPALVGLAAAILVGPRVDLRRRAFGAAALSAGIVLGLVYDLVQARYVHVGLREFLTSGTNDGFYAQLAARERRRVLLDGGWLGAELRVLLVFALIYALVRLMTRHRPAVLVAMPAAVLWSWLGPHLAGSHGVRVGILGIGGVAEQTAVLVLAACLLLALFAPVESAPSRLQLGRALVWAAPPFLVWALRVVYDNRLLAPAWSPLIVLIVWALLPVLSGARAWREWLVLVPTAALLALGAYSVQNIDGLGSSGWRALEAGGISGLGNKALMRNIALGGDFASEVSALAPQVSKGDRILTFDARLRFFYLSQIDYAPPLACAQLAGHRLFVLLESDELRAIYGRRSTAAFWESCPGKPLTKIEERPGAYAIFVHGSPKASVGGCGAPQPAPGLAVEFGPGFRTEAQASAFLKHVVDVGFVEARVEQAGCASYRVVETGIPDRGVGASVVDEAHTAKIVAQLVNR
jgi:hypothetical protein